MFTVSTFFVLTDVDPCNRGTTGGSADYRSLLEAMTEYEDARERIAIGTCVNAGITVMLWDDQTNMNHEILLDEAGDWDNPDIEPDPDDEKAHRDWRIRQGEPDCT